MVTVLLALLFAQQSPQATVQVDRTEVTVGGIVTLTLTVRAAASVPVQIEEPAFPGFEVVDRRDRSQVAVDEGVRTTVRDIRIRARRPGTVTIRPFRVREENRTIESAAITLTVSGAVPEPPALGARVRAIVQRARPVPAADSDAVVVAVLPSADTVMLGEQVDLVVAAWFPRGVRDRLRAPPTVLPPDVRGAWGYSQVAPTGVVASREVAGRAYDLFIYHEIVFALRPGDLEIGPATVAYSLPVSGSFLSREVRQERQSPAFLIAVEPPPDGSEGSVLAARSLAIRVSAPDTVLRVGDAAVMTVAVTGVGNVALWPEPELDWPEGVHAYQQRATVDVTPQDGLIAGTKAFEYLVVADTAGRHVLPAPRLMYYDLGNARFQTVAAEPVVLLTPEGVSRVMPVRAIRPLLEPTWWSGVAALARAVPRWGWLLVFAVPPLIALALRAGGWSWRARRDGRLGRGGDGNGLGPLEARLRNVLERLVPGAAMRGGESLADALVAAGVEPSLAGHAARVRERLRLARYGPRGAADVGELAEEVQAVLSGLPTERAGAAGRAVVAGAALLLLAAAPSHAQTVEQLWEAGAARAVAESMDARVRTRPDAADAWYGLGLAWQRLGAAARAHAAWLHAARLAPRRGPIREAAMALRRVDRTGQHLLWTSPVTPWEALLLAAVLWAVGWAAVVRRRRRAALVALLAAVLLLGLGAVVRERYRTAIGFVLASATPLREAPFGPAPSETELPEGVAVRVESSRGDWRLVSYNGREGWVHASELVVP